VEIDKAIQMRSKQEVIKLVQLGVAHSEGGQNGGIGLVEIQRPSHWQ